MRPPAALAAVLDRTADVRAHRRAPPADLATRVGSVALPNPVMTASGTSGHGAELGRYLDLSSLGAVVVKSLSARPWPGNPGPRIYETSAGMLNSVGLQGPGVEAWLACDLPALVASGARVVASIWGHRVEDYAEAAALLADAPAEVVAVEVNLSCPNIDPSAPGGAPGRARLFASSEAATNEAMEATAACGRPRWAKLSVGAGDLVAVAAAARVGGAEAVTLINTVPAMAIDPATGRRRLGGPGGGLSGPAIHPVAIRAVHDVTAAVPDLPIVGVGGVASGEDAAELLLAGAVAVQVGTATFADPRAPAAVLAGLRAWAQRRGVRSLPEVVGAVHRGGRGGDHD
ncbi:MAG TPA: dihydroorotate dehydrogenase [Acidimicrobiales bacterium]|nr:dihydroorotate dehydrogenase [Acidimicrobiales bacterium]